jgi:hypothetical protein
MLWTQICLVTMRTLVPALGVLRKTRGRLSRDGRGPTGKRGQHATPSLLSNNMQWLRLLVEKDWKMGVATRATDLGLIGTRWSVLLSSTVWKPASTATAWACKNATGGGISACGTESWYCYCVQTSVTSGAYRGYYCGHRTTTWRKIHRCAAVAAWAGSANFRSFADLEAHTGRRPFGARGLHNPFYEDGGILSKIALLPDLMVGRCLGG